MSLALPPTEWPAVDQQLWARLCRQGGPLDDRGAFAQLREATLTTRAAHYGRWIRWLVVTESETLNLPPAERVTAARLKAWLEDLAHTAPVSQRSFVDSVMAVACAADLARDWTPELRLRRALRARANASRSCRKEGRILSSEMLFDSGRRLANEEAPKLGGCIRRAIAIRDGAMIAMLALMPMRRRAFAGLRLGVSILAQEAGYTIALPGDLTKSGLPWEADVPHPAAELLRSYLCWARPVFAERGGNSDDHLWLGFKGKGLGGNQLGAIVAARTRQMTGTAVSPHLFRDAAATTLARHSPQASRLIRPVLAHTTDGVAERHYIHATSIDAGRRYADLIARMKSTAAR